MSNIADVAELQRVAVASLNQRMAAFEEHLKASTPGSDLSTLQKDFCAFKEHVWSVLSVLQQQIQDLSSSVDAIEMRHRRKFLLLGGVPEQPNEMLAEVVTTILRDKMAQPDLKPSSLTVCHRLGISSKKPRPILLRFADLNVRAAIWKAKTKLKGSSFVLSEFLTRQRQTTFATARKLFGVTNAWTMDGNIYIKLPDGNRHRVLYLEEVVALGMEYGKSLEASAGTTTSSNSKQASSVPAVSSTRSRRNVKNK